MEKLAIVLDRSTVSDDDVEARNANYYERLGPQLTDAEFLAAVDRARDELHMFPRISDLLEYGLWWRRLWWRRRQASGVDGERPVYPSAEERRANFKLGADIIGQVLKAKGLLPNDTPSLEESKRMRKKP